MTVTAKLVGNTQPTPSAITPNAALTTPQKAAVTALQTARATFENSGNAVYIGEVNVLLTAIDNFLLAMV